MVAFEEYCVWETGVWGEGEVQAMANPGQPASKGPLQLLGEGEIYRRGILSDLDQQKLRRNRLPSHFGERGLRGLRGLRELCAVCEGGLRGVVRGLVGVTGRVDQEGTAEVMQSPNDC